MKPLSIVEKIIDRQKNSFWSFFVLLILLTGCMAFFYYPLHPGQDFHFHYYRLQALIDALNGGLFLFYTDTEVLMGYGYLTRVFYSDLLLLPFAIAGCFTNTFIAYQIMIIVLTLLCGIFTYICVKKIYGSSFVACFSSLLYTFCFYRLLDIYHRAALGEVLSFSFLPIALLGLYYVIFNDYKKWYILAIGYSLIIFSHLISSVLLFVAILITLCLFYKRMKDEPIRIAYLFLAAGITVLLTSGYILPFLEQLADNKFYFSEHELTSKAEDSTLKLNWIIWGMFGGILQSRQLFLPGIGILLTMTVLVRVFISEKNEKLKNTDKLTILGILFIVAISSLFPWSFFPFRLLNFIQMPWRLYEFISLLFAITGAYYCSCLLKSTKRRVVCLTIGIIITLCMFASDGELFKSLRGGRPIDESPAPANNYQTGFFEYMPAKVPSVEFLEKRSRSAINLNNEEETAFTYSEGHIYSFHINESETGTYELPLLYYKGYEGYIHNKRLAVSQSKNGLLQVTVPQSGMVTVKYAGTFLQIFGLCLNVISTIGLCVFIFLSSRKRNNHLLNPK